MEEEQRQFTHSTYRENTEEYLSHQMGLQKKQEQIREEDIELFKEVCEENPTDNEELQKHRENVIGEYEGRIDEIESVRKARIRQRLEISTPEEDSLVQAYISRYGYLPSEYPEKTETDK